MARTATYQQAINEALAQEMERDETVIIMGEDVAGGLGTDGERDAWGGPLGHHQGALRQVRRSGHGHPDQRVRLHRRRGRRSNRRSPPGRGS